MSNFERDDSVEMHVGSVSGDREDWRDGTEETDPDDELLKQTPADVIEMLGFDPLELLEDDEPASPDKQTKRLEAPRKRRGESGQWRYTCKDCGHVRVESETGDVHARSEKCKQCGGVAFGGVVASNA